MHTFLMVVAGLVVLGLFLGIGRLWAMRSPGATRRAAVWFLPVWLLVAALNMVVGVVEAGHPVAEEWPYLLVVFGLPAIAALFAWWRLRPRRAPGHRA